MSRPPVPAEVRRRLRHEVGFGCPVTGCRKPFLTYHHFDPPWEPCHVHNPDGMIALCREHHNFADGGLWSTAELRALKRVHPDPREVRAHLPWAKSNLLIRFGSLYVDQNPNMISMFGKRLFGVRRGEEDLVELEMLAFGETDVPAFRITENVLEVGTCSLHDIDTLPRAQRITIKSRPGHIMLDMSFGRILPAKLDEILERDRTIAGSPEVDVVGMKVREVALHKCIDDEGRIPFVNVRRFRSSFRGQSVEAGKGVSMGGTSLYYGEAFGREECLSMRPNPERAAEQVGAERSSSIGLTFRRPRPSM